MKDKLRWMAGAALASSVIGLGIWNQDRPRALEPGAQAPAFALPDLAGGMTRLSSYRGKLLLLNFWASWCDSCAQEMPAIDALYRRHRGRGLALLAASVDGARPPVMEFVSRNPVSFPVALADARATASYGVRMLPTSFLIGRDGRLLRVYQGPLDVAALENDILAQLEKRP